MTTPPGSVLSEAVDQLLTKLHEHEDAATEIRATLKELRRKMAGGGKRAGAKARSGRKPRKPAVEVTDLRKPTTDNGDGHSVETP